MKTTSQNILNLIKTSNGLKASEIAQKLNLDKNEVKAVLLTDLKDLCYQDTRYKWYFHQDDLSVVNNKKNVDTKLSNNFETSNKYNVLTPEPIFMRIDTAKKLEEINAKRS